MNIQDYRFLLSQRASLNNLLERIGDEHVLTRKSFERRLRQVETELEAYEAPLPQPAEARLTFHGKPVVGSRGMSARFFSEALDNFATLVHYIGSSLSGNPLSTTGPAPHKSDYEILIAGTAHGSFGFRVEEASGQLPLEGQDTHAGAAIKKFKAILEASKGTDEELSEAIEHTDARALGSVEKFLRNVAKNEAVCALEFRRDKFEFIDVEQVQRSANRLSQDNILEDNVSFVGRFQGFLPKAQQAEVRIAHAEADFLQRFVETVIKCQVKPESEAADVAEINTILDREVRICARARRVSAEGRPRFVVTRWELVE